MKITKRKVTKRPAAPAATPAPPVPFVLPAPISATLSPQASDLVRWYCGITKHFEHNTVEGAVYGVLERAKQAYEGTPGMDEAFDWLMEDVIRAKNDDIRFPIRRSYHGGVTTHLGQTASALLSRYLSTEDVDPRDVVSGCVACLLDCQLNDSSRDMGQYIKEASRERQANEAESRRASDATAALHARKEVAA